MASLDETPAVERVLILGGTGQARRLASELALNATTYVILSLAGNTSTPHLPPERHNLRVRTGGFGGVDGLKAYLRAQAIDRVIDASHPFASTISAHATEACTALAVPLENVSCPPWQPGSGDLWHRVPSMRAAADLVPQLGQRVLLTTGRRNLDAFAGCHNQWFLIRTIEPVAHISLKRYALLRARGPFPSGAEQALLRSHRIDLVIAKNTGGRAMRGKLDAANTLQQPVILIER